ncbi:PREDICTED: uncharacterized protein LOC108620182 [Drosophila arizonae]|uniref:Uncharacterized protein LOC108620182 n=1 Tax=Drosophila arizonae TaxID=7263 RepID=A0ABM1PZD6_DROAR|nr:PREDICTED: uncharacterized protein LOC108620182 [Drosophila arizonae]
MQLGHYKDNPEYTDHFTEWRLFRHSGKPLPAKVLIADKFKAYDNLRLDLEQLMEARVSELDFEMKRLPSNHKCMRFYLKQKLELERAYTRTNEVKQKVIRKNTNPCPFEPSVQRAIQIIDKNTNSSSSHVQIHNNGSKDYNARKVIIAKIDVQINSKLGHYEDNKEYSEKLSKLIRAKKSGSSNIELLYLLAKFQEYNSQRLNLEEKIDDRLSDITFVVKALAKPHKCVKFYSHQSWALKRVYQRENSVKIKVLRANSVKCPYECDPHNQNRTTIAPQ